MGLKLMFLVLVFSLCLAMAAPSLSWAKAKH